MLVKNLVDGTSISADTQSSVEYFHMPKSNRGIAQIKASDYSGLTNIVITLEGRLNADHEWETVKDSGGTNVASTFTGNNDSSFPDIQLWPEMRFDLNVTGTGSVTIQATVGG